MVGGSPQHTELYGRVTASGMLRTSALDPVKFPIKMNHSDLQTNVVKAPWSWMAFTMFWLHPPSTGTLCFQIPLAQEVAPKEAVRGGQASGREQDTAFSCARLRTIGIRRCQQRTRLPWPCVGQEDIWKRASVTSPLSSGTSGCVGESHGLLFVPDFQGHLKKAPQTGGAHKSLPCVLGARAEIKEWHSRFLRPKG